VQKAFTFLCSFCNTLVASSIGYTIVLYPVCISYSARIHSQTDPLHITMYLSLTSASQTISEQQKWSFPNLSQQRTTTAAKAVPLPGWTGEGIAGGAGDGIFALFSTAHWPCLCWCPQLKRHIGKWERLQWGAITVLSELENPV